MQRLRNLYVNHFQFARLNILRKMELSKIYSPVWDMMKLQVEFFNKIECYVCIVYKKSKLKSINEARLDTFLKEQKRKSEDEVIICVKKIFTTTFESTLTGSPIT